MIFAAISMVINVIFSIILFTHYKHVGIAIATSIAGWANALLLGILLYKRGHFITDKALLIKLPRIILSSLIMGVTLYYAAVVAEPYLQLEHGIWIRFLTLFALVTCGVLAYGVSAELTGATSLKSLKNSLRPNRQ
jgi:putative peptidoglycan lipid II flippase